MKKIITSATEVKDTFNEPCSGGSFDTTSSAVQLVPIANFANNPNSILAKMVLETATGATDTATALQVLFSAARQRTRLSGRFSEISEKIAVLACGQFYAQPHRAAAIRYRRHGAAVFG
jgi:hypothetical protein